MAADMSAYDETINDPRSWAPSMRRPMTVEEFTEWLWRTIALATQKGGQE